MLLLLLFHHRHQVECGSHWVASAAIVAKEVLLNYLKALDMVDEAFYAEHAVRYRNLDLAHQRRNALAQR